jgi:hypothetical protein
MAAYTYTAVGSLSPSGLFRRLINITVGATKAIYGSFWASGGPVWNTTTIPYACPVWPAFYPREGYVPKKPRKKMTEQRAFEKKRMRQKARLW